MSEDLRYLRSIGAGRAVPLGTMPAPDDGTRERIVEVDENGTVRNVGPAPVDDPAPYRPSSEASEKLFERCREEIKSLSCGYDAKRRLTIAAQFMAAYVGNNSIVDGFLREDALAVAADRSILAADALIARWKETT